MNQPPAQRAITPASLCPDACERRAERSPAPLTSKARRTKRLLPAHDFVCQENSAHFRILILSLVSYGLRRMRGQEGKK